MNTDGRINIAINVDGNEVEQARKGVKGLGDDAKGVKPGADQASKGIKEISTSLALVKIGAAAFSVLAKSMDSAISRFDTFNTFPNVMSALGESTEDSDRAINRLSDGIDGLPTKLDDIVTTTQRMYSTFKNLDESTDTALALNNALLASGASVGDAQRGSEQYIQSLQKGKFEMEEWKTLQETMTIGLSMIAESFGMTERELKDALDSGVISMDDFNDRMIELGTGTGDLAELAKENSKTIETALTNLRNTASRGLADIIEAFSDMTEEISGRSLYDNLESLKGVINSAFKAISTTIRNLAPVVILLVTAFQGLVKVVKVLSPLLLGLVSAYTALLAIRKVNSVIENNRKALQGLSIVTALLTKEMHGKTIAQLASTKATSADLIAQIASNKTLTAKNVVLGLLTKQMSLSTAATLLKAKAVTVLNGVMTALSGPIGWVVGGIGLLAAGGVALVKWLNRSTEEGERLAGQTEALGEATNELTGEIDSNTASYEKQVRRTEASAKANTDLAQKIGELTSQENLSTKQKKELQESIELLNNEVEGLNVAYDEEAKALNMSSEEMQKRIELKAEEDKYTAAQERQLEISKEQREVDMQLKDVIALRELYQEQKDNDIITNKEYKDSIAELDEQEKALNDTLEILAVKYGVTEEAMKEAMENQHEVAKTITGEQIILYEGLSDSLKQTVDSMRESYLSLQEAATDAFSKIETKTDHTMASMIETLKHNQTAVEEWGQNQAKTIKWAGENGYESLIPYIESMTIDSAAELAVLAGATDEEMTKFAEAMEEGGATGKDAFLEAHQMSEEDFNAVKHLVTETKTALTTQIEEADFASIGKDVTDGLVKGIKVGKVEARDATGEVADDMIEQTRQTLQTHSPSKVFTEIGKDVTDGLAVGVLMNIRTVTDALDIVVRDMPLRFDTMPEQFRQIGEQIMNGLVRGLNNGRGRVMSTARSIANSAASTMRQALDIHSPSRVMKSIGAYTTLGFTEGMASKKDEADNISQGMADSIIKAAENMNKEIKATTKAANAERAEIEKRSQEDINKIRDKARKDNRKLTKEENIQIRRMTEDKAKKIKKVEEGLANDIIKIEENKAKRVEEIKRDQFNHSKKWIDREKYYNRLSQVEELAAWERVQARYVAGSDERIDADRQVYRMKNEINNQLKSLNSDYLKSVQDLNQKLADEENKLNEEYAKAVDNRAKSLYSFAGIFDEIKNDSAVSGQQLINNLKGQVNTFSEWSNNINSLASRGIDDSLLSELRDMGPKASAEIEALNNLSDDQLTEYVGLWQTKSRLARTQAVEELEGMRIDTEYQIKELHKRADKQLEALEKDWVSKVEEIRYGTKDELEIMESDLKTIGKQSMQGLINGLASMEGAVMAKARSIANSVRATMQSALDINSPSGVMSRDVGRWIPAGIAKGIEDNLGVVDNAMSKVGMLISTPETALGVGRMSVGTGPNTIAGGSGIQNNSSKTYTPTINNYFTRDESTPSEVARENKKQQQRLAMEWGY